MQAAARIPSPRTALRPRWVTVDPPDSGTVFAIASELRLPELIARLLVQRGYGDSAAIRAFLRPHVDQILPPAGLAGMADAVDRITAAIRGGEVILIHGDYDVDGVCGTALLVRSLAMMGARALPFVPHRIRDGYDLGPAGIAAARSAGATLIVTTDCGIVAHDAVAAAGAAGIDVVVTDHHTPGATLPAAVAVVNPNRPDCPYPDKGLAGVGVAFKLASAVADAVGFPRARLAALLDLVALATIADLAPLSAENRALVRWGLDVLPRTPNRGLRALLRACGLGDKDEITAGQVAFVLAPRLNAVGRVGQPMDAVRLLLTDDAREAEQLAAQLETENRRRQALDEETLADARRVLDRGYDPERDWGVVLASDRWHPGVIGIVASRIVEQIHRPTVLIALAGAEGKGSARSIRGFHLHEAFVACAEHLTRFGGHRAAAGCSVRADRIDAFREAFNAAAHRMLSAERLVPELRVDGMITVAEANADLLRLLRHFAPFGIGNPTPIFAAYGVRVDGAPRVVGQRHLKLAVRADDARLEGIGFGLADRLAECGGDGGRIDIAFRLEENEWRSRDGRLRRDIQVSLVDLRAAE